jgi:biotin operon repressor
VYSYIRALRSLGRNRVNTGDVAEALSLSLDQVNRAIQSLEEKGVKVSNG